MKTRNIAKTMAFLAAGTLLTVSTSRGTLTWTSPLAFQPGNGIVGIATGLTGSANGSANTEMAIAQELLNLPANYIGIPSPAPFSSQIYATGPDDYSGTLAGAYTHKDRGDVTSVASGWDYVIAKYAGKKGGYVLFYLGGQEATLPEYPYSFWWNGASDRSYGISGYTAFNFSPVPEPATLLAGAVLLLPFGVSTLRILRRNRAARRSKASGLRFKRGQAAA